MSRKGAGRPKGDRVSHRARPVFGRPAPAHVTVANALAYVGTNARRHYGKIEIDYFSSDHAE